MTNSLYAIGDIHGDLAKFEAALAWIADDRRQSGLLDAPIVLLGDLVDRRHQSKEVIDLILALQKDGEPILSLKGNHDRMFALFFEDPALQDPILRKDLTWLNPRLGGDTTLASYGVLDANTRPLAEVHAEAMEKVPESHRALLTSLPTHFETDHVFLAHAGIRPDVALGDQIEDDLIWIRAPFHAVATPHPKLIIHGHTPVDAVTHYGNRINIDTGCAYGGPLSVIVVEGADVFELRPSGRKALAPID